jgi:hypothetical protein
MEITAAAHHRARDAYEAAWIDSQPFKAGDVIRSKKGALAVVDGYYVKYGSVRLIARLKNKDGSFGKRRISEWRTEWNNPVKVESYDGKTSSA